MGGLWFAIAVVCVLTGLALLWWDRRRTRGADTPPAPAPDGQSGDLFRESHPR